MLFLTRHGPTDENARGVLLGRADPPLSEVGRRQVEALARVLPPDARVVSSPLRRARETAAILGATFEVDERWIELDYGSLDGREPASVPEDVWTRWRADVDFAPPGGESLAALGARVRAACSDLALEAGERDIVVVTHVSPIKAAIAWVLGAGDEIAWRMFVKDCSVSRIAIGPSGPVLLSFNEVPDGGNS